MGKITRQELHESINQELDKIGLLSDLTTTDKSTIVNAINEVNTATQTAQTTANSAAAAATGAQADIDAHIADYVRQPGYATATGSANTYAVTLSPAPTALVDGFAVAVKINIDNTGASTLNVNGLGAKPIKKANGNDVAAGNLKAGSVYTLRYNGTNFILQGEGGSGTAQPSDVLSGKTFTNDQGEQTGTMINRAGHNTGQSVSLYGTRLRIRPYAGYYPGDAANSVQWNEPNLQASNIKEGVSLFGLVGTLVEGKKWATGIAPKSNSSFTVTGLAFQPGIVIVTTADINTGVAVFVDYTKYPGWNGRYNAALSPNHDFAYWVGITDVVRKDYAADGSLNHTFTSDGFTVPTIVNNIYDHRWLAIE